VTALEHSAQAQYTRIPRKYLLFLTLVTSILVALGIGIAYKSSDKSWTFTAKGRSYSLLIADTQTSRTQGLSGMTEFHFDQAMLFVFDEQKERCMWMKDMRFNIDIMWLDSAYKVTGLEHNVTPATFPKSFCHEGKYVLEFTAGELARTGAKVGETVNLRP
jgi:uncharacterized membrane protein (UPF0127 family)